MALSNTQPNGIKQVLRGTVVINNGASTGSATITAVDMQKSELRFLGMRTAAGGIELTSATTIAANRTGTAGLETIHYELTERW